MTDPVETVDRFAVPQKIEPVLRAFPAYVIGTLIPEWDAIPEEFFSWSYVWNRWASAFFLSGWPQNFRVWPRYGIDPELAATHLRTVLRSYEPKHEHKLAAVGYLASRWFEDIEDLT